MIEYNVYPNGKKAAVTFSYDDGHENDTKLISLFNKYGMKATFHLIGNKYLNLTEAQHSEQREIYKGHEISGHTLNHGFIDKMSSQTITKEVVECRKILEDIFKVPVLGMSYPFGIYNDEIVNVLKSCGVLYSRTAADSGLYDVSYDFYRWNPTCHQSIALDKARQFADILSRDCNAPVLYIWGHSYEFENDKDWNQLEEALKILSNNDDIWYATNMDIYNYVNAQRRLQISYDEKIIYNPSAFSVWIKCENKQILEIPAGKTVNL